VCIYILRIPTLNSSIIRHILTVASSMKILFQICCVHYLLFGNTAGIDFEDDSSLVSQSESEDKKSLKGMASAKKISVRAELHCQIGRPALKPSETPRWRITPGEF